jgi:tetratricopeptide (TPR) repeat protein
MIGQTVAQYEITARLGGGGMGVVYLARDTKLGRAVALKFLPPQWCHDEGAKQRFLREAQAASATNHKNICIIHDIEQTDDGQLFIVMAHYEGPTLKQKLEAGPLAPAEAIEIAGEIAEGLAKAHTQGVVHRDIKPGNIIVTDDGVKILDFGLAKLADAALKLTLEGSTLGTVAYMSPEQARGEEADERSDIWALGVVLYEMLTGEVPFKGAYPEAIFYAIKNEEPASLTAKAKELPEGVEAIVRRALAKDPGERYQNARELARELRFLQGRSVPLDLRTEAVPIPRSAARVARKRHAIRVAAAAAVLLAGAGGTYYWLSRPLPRIPIAIVPFANHSGESALDPYRLALTQSLVGELADSPNLRVTPYPRLLETIRRYLLGAGDISSREAIAAIGSNTGAMFLVVPSLENSAGAWAAKAELRNVQTGTSVATVQTDPVATALPLETAQRLITSLAATIQRQFRPSWPHRLPAESPVGGRFRNLEAARSFEQGLNAYEQNEYASALAAFKRAIEQDGQRPISYAWAAKTALLMGDLKGAEADAGAGVQIVGADAPKAVTMLASAVLAEARNDSAAAERHYRELAALHADDASLQVELADFYKRKNRNEPAVEAYHRVLAIDSGYVRTHVDLCQLYAFLDDYPLSERHAQSALRAFRASGNRGGEAQALLCHGDALLQQGKLKEGRDEIEAAHVIFASLGYPYGLARVFQYLGLAAGREPNYPAAAQSFEEALARSLQVGNRILQGVALMNLGVAHESMGHASQAMTYYERSRDAYRALGDERRAAEQEVNAVALQVSLGRDPVEISKRLTNTLATLRKLSLADFEVQALQAQGENEAAAGHLEAAQRTLHEAAAIANERGLRNQLRLLNVAVARVSVLQNDYESARKLLSDAVADGTMAPDVHIGLGHVLARLGDFDNAREHLERAHAQMSSTGEMALAPLLHEAYGELLADAGSSEAARKHFQEAASSAAGDLPTAAALEARCHLGSFPADLTSVHNVTVRAECAVEEARRAFERRDHGKALETLRHVQTVGVEIGPELMARLHYWRASALARQGDTASADEERASARKLASQIQATLSSQFKDRFASRGSIRPLME